MALPIMIMMIECTRKIARPHLVAILWSVVGVMACSSWRGKETTKESREAVSEPSLSAPVMVGTDAFRSAATPVGPDSDEYGDTGDAVYPIDTDDTKGDDATREDVVFPLHAMARFFSTVIMSRPEAGAPRVGYFRRGTGFRVREIASRDGCERGWYEVSSGGYVCAGRGISVSTHPIELNDAPPFPRLDDPLPYRYRVIKRDGVMSYRRLPSASQVAEVADLARFVFPQEVDEASLHDSGVDFEVPLDIDAVDWPPVVNMPLYKGFHVSITDESKWRGGVRYRKTLRGNYIQSNRLYRIRPSRLEGTMLGPDVTLPLVFVVRGNARTMVSSMDKKGLFPGKKVARYKAFPALGERIYKGETLVKIDENTYINSRRLRRAERIAVPHDVGADERWIAIDLGEQTLVAYEGAQPVFATLVASGKAGTATPEGTYRVYYKHVSTTMDELEDVDDRFSIEDVPWTQYYHAGYALHGAYWHDWFGWVRSRGCINLSPADAQWLFYWTGPHLPEGVHGMAATDANPGTLLWVYR